MTERQKATFTKRKLEQLRMLMDWQIRELGYDPAEITCLCVEKDDCAPGPE